MLITTFAAAVSAAALHPSVASAVAESPVWLAQETAPDASPVRRGPQALRKALEARRKARAEDVASPELKEKLQEASELVNQPTSRTKTNTRAAQAEPQSGGSSDEAIDFEKRARAGKFSFEFSKAEIMDVVKAISNLTRRNFIVPEKIKSQRITILSPTKINAREAWSVFLAALEVNGITVVRSGKFYKLVEAKEAQKSPIPLCIGDDDNCPKYTDYMVTYLLRLNHIEANQLNGIVKSMVSKEGQVTVFQPSNALVISDYAPNITRIRRIIDTLDVAGGDDEIQIVQIKFATASEVSETVKQVFEVDAQPAQGANARRNRARRNNNNNKDNDAGGDEAENEVKISKIVADDRTNQIIIRANQRSFEAISQLISRIDVPVPDGEQGKVHVVYLENASAEDLAGTLSSLSSGANSSTPAANRTRRPPPNNAAQANSGPESAALFEGEVQVTAETSTNSLIIIASPRDFRSLRRIIAQLDLPRRQVYVEAAIMEVTVTGDTQLGTNWHLPFSEDGVSQDIDSNGSLGFIQGAPGGGISPTLAPLTDAASLLSITSGSVVGLVGQGVDVAVGSNTISLPSFGVILRALQSASNAQVLSTPHILTTDNEEASIEVGQRIPFQRGTAIPQVANLGGAGGAAGQQLGQFNNLFSATDRIDVSLKLTLTPQINELDKIRLEIDQQIEDIVGSDPATQQPITANRAAQTVVVVDDQQTVVLGGLIRDRTRETENKIPILGDLPIIGWLFKSRTTELEKVNLVLVLTPYIIRDSADFQRIFERKIKEYEQFAEEFYGDTAEYRAFVDYERKTGPLAMLASRVRAERALVENGGEGEGEQLVQPERRDVEFRPLLNDEEGDEVVMPDEEPAAPDPDDGGEQ
ncbi:MAG: type II secretion system secretin GspD [Myxococcota bacterium]